MARSKSSFMHSSPQQNISQFSEQEDIDSNTRPTMESVLEWLSDSSVHPRNKVDPFQWFHVPTLLTTQIRPEQQHQQDERECEQQNEDQNDGQDDGQDEEQNDEHEEACQNDQHTPLAEDNNQLLSRLLQRIATFLDECFDSNTPIPNKRRLHSSLSQLAQSRTLARSVVRDVEKCVAALKGVNESPLVVVETWQLDEMESMARTMAAQKEQLARQSELEREAEMLRADKQTFISDILSLQREKEETQQANEQLRNELTNKKETLNETDKLWTRAQQTIERLKMDVTDKEQFLIPSDIIVAFSPSHFRVSGSTVTQLMGSWTGCFTRAVSNGIHRLSIRNVATKVMIGVLDAMEFPKHLTKSVYDSPKAALMYNTGELYSAGGVQASSTKPQPGQEFWAEADLENRTVHFFVDGVQQPHHFTNIPVPLVFALDVCSPGVQIEILAWEELKESHVTSPGIGHALR